MSISFHALAHHHRHVSLTVDEPVARSEKHDWQCDDGSGETDVDYLDGQYDGYMIGIDEDSDIDMDMDSQVREWEQERTRASSDSTNSIMSATSTTSTASYQSTSTAVSAFAAASSPKHSAPFSPSSADQVQSPLSVSSTSSGSTPSSPSPISHKPHNMQSPKSYLHSPAKSSPPPSVDGRSLSRRSDSRIIALHDKRVALNRKLYRVRMAAGAGAGVGAAAAAAGLAIPRRPRNSITLTVPHPTPNASPLPSSVSVSASHTASLNTVPPVFAYGTALAAPAPALETPQPSQSLYHDTVSPVCCVDPSAECRHPDPAYNIYTYREIGRHVSLSSCWLVVRGRVYDITRFIPHHPAGNFSLLKHAGTDATEHFKMHSPEAQRLWETFQIGWLQGYREQARTPQSNDKCSIM